MMISEMEIEYSTDEVLNSSFPLHRACRDGDVSALYSLVHRTVNYSDLTAEDTCYGWTPIHWAARFGKLECVVHLVRVGCDVNTATTKLAQTPVHIATFGGHPECVLWLLKAGADTNKQDYGGEAPVHKAARAGSPDCVRTLLLHGAKPDLRNAAGLTAADLAYAQGFWECFQLLSNAQNHLVQLSRSLTAGPSTWPCEGQPNGAGGRKRLLDEWENMCNKKARTDNDTKGLFNGFLKPADTSWTGPSEALLRPPAVRRAPLKRPAEPSAEKKPSSFTPADREAPGETGQRHGADMCGSLHRSGSPGVCVAPMTSDPGDLLHYGHHHGFGDTAEDISAVGTRPQPLV